jgi:hypothetical protein
VVPQEKAPPKRGWSLDRTSSEGPRDRSEAQFRLLRFGSQPIEKSSAGFCVSRDRARFRRACRPDGDFRAGLIKKTSAVVFQTAEATRLLGGHPTTSKQGLFPTTRAGRQFPVRLGSPTKGKPRRGKRGFLKQTAEGSRGGLGTAVYSPE